MPAFEVKFSPEAADRIDRLIAVMERLATATEKQADLADFEANGPRG